MAMLKIFLLSLMLWSVSGCQTLTEKRQTDVLVETLKQYEATLRWGAIQQAQSFASQDIPTYDPGRNKDLRIIQYEVVQGPTQVSEDKALQSVMIQYVHETSQSVKELFDQQIWTYDEETEKWSLQSPFPAFK